MNEETTTQEQETQQAPQAQPQPAAPMKPQQGIGDMMKEGTRKAVAGLAVLLLIGAYVTGLIYAEVHGLNLLRTGVAPDLLMWAYAGMFTLGALAIALPLLLHFHAFDPAQRIWTYVFYAFDLALLGANSFIDFSGNNGRELVQWALMYRDFVLPATPVIASIMATVLLLLDPHARALIVRQTLRAAMMRKQADLIMERANDPAVMATVDAAAQQEVADSLTELFGYRVEPVTGYVMDTNRPARRSAAARFFDWLSERVTSLAASGMPGQSQPPASDEPSQDEQTPQA